MATCTDGGFVRLTLRKVEGGVTEIFVNPHWIVEIRPNAEKGADLVLVVERNERTGRAVQVEESVEDIWTKIQECRQEPAIPGS